ncbi:MAG: flagellar biosynthesis anti-sigma factor FlgM [Spirochaetaceae bacterium]|nr:MAG: flagellar biosynthesis anti-sigma factor FlgM [Spirochaetaceae bacterium]
MSIERLGPIDPVQRFNQTTKSAKPQAKAASDSIAFSDEAKLRAELLQMSEQVRDASDVRMDRIAEVRKKLEDPSYINDTVVNSVAERIMDAFGI